MSRLWPLHDNIPNVGLWRSYRWVSTSPVGSSPITKRWSPSSSVFKGCIFSHWLVLAIPPQWPWFENNHAHCVCQLFEELTTTSNCSYYSHLRLLEQLCFKKAAMIADLFLASRNGGRSSGVFTLRGLTFACICTLLTLLSTSRLRWCFVIFRAADPKQFV